MLLDTLVRSPQNGAMHANRLQRSARISGSFPTSITWLSNPTHHGHRYLQQPQMQFVLSLASVSTQCQRLAVPCIRRYSPPQSPNYQRSARSFHQQIWMRIAKFHPRHRPPHVLFVCHATFLISITIPIHLPAAQPLTIMRGRKEINPKQRPLQVHNLPASSNPQNPAAEAVLRNACT